MGTYKGRVAEDIKRLITAALVTGQNVMIVGGPGTGKTTIARSYAEQLFGNDYCMARIEPTSAPEKLKGSLNIQKFFTDGEWSINVTNTPYAPNNRLVILDEFGRANSALFDLMMFICDRVGETDAPPVIGTSNFLPTGERQQALLDRFSLYYWVQPEPIALEDIMNAHLSGNVPHLDVSDLSWERIQAAKEVKISERGKKAVHKTLSALIDEAQQNSRVLNPRRVTQWVYLLSRMSAYSVGHGDFNRVPDEACDLLKYAYPTLSSAEQLQWAEIAGSVADAVGTAIDAITANLYSHLQKNNAIAPNQRIEKSTEFGRLLQGVVTSLKELGEKHQDERCAEAVVDVKRIFSDWLAGK